MERGAGTLTLFSEGFRKPVVIRYQPADLAPQVEDIRVEDARLKAVWGSLIRRILLVHNKPPQAGRYSVVITQAS